MMQKSTIPEIQRANLTSVVLQLLALDIHALYFDFMDKPPEDAIVAAFNQLKLLGAVDNIEKCSLTSLGEQMVKFPLDPRFSKILLSASNYGCLEEVLTIVSLLSVESILLTPPNKREQVQTIRRKFHSAYGDHITLLNIYREYTNVGQNCRSWCHEHYINMRNILQAREVRSQLEEICTRAGMTLTSCGSQMDQVRKCLLSGLFMNVAELHRDKQYITVILLLVCCYKCLNVFFCSLIRDNMLLFIPVRCCMDNNLILCCLQKLYKQQSVTCGCYRQWKVIGCKRLRRIIREHTVSNVPEIVDKLRKKIFNLKIPISSFELVFNIFYFIILHTLSFT